MDYITSLKTDSLLRILKFLKTEDCDYCFFGIKNNEEIYLRIDCHDTAKHLTDNLALREIKPTSLQLQQYFAEIKGGRISGNKDLFPELNFN